MVEPTTAASLYSDLDLQYLCLKGQSSGKRDAQGESPQVMKRLKISFHFFPLMTMPARLVGYCQGQIFSMILS